MWTVKGQFDSGMFKKNAFLINWGLEALPKQVCLLGFFVSLFSSKSSLRSISKEFLCEVLLAN